MSKRKVEIRFSKTSDIKWKDAKKFHDGEYSYQNVYFKYDDKHIYLKIQSGHYSDGKYCYYKKPQKGTGSKLFHPTYYLTIINYKNHTATDILRRLDEMGNRTRHTEDCILQFYKGKGLDLGFTTKILRPLC